MAEDGSQDGAAVRDGKGPRHGRLRTPLGSAHKEHQLPKTGCTESGREAKARDDPRTDSRYASRAVGEIEDTRVGPVSWSGAS